jgi:hypothetical protein
LPEIRQEWFYREGRDLVFVVGKERKKHRKSDLPIFLGRFDGFRDLTIPADEPQSVIDTFLNENSWAQFDGELGHILDNVCRRLRRLKWRGSCG